MDNQPSRSEEVSFMNQAYNDLQWKYTRYASEVERLWRTYNSEQRASCLKAGAADGVVLKSRNDKSMAAYKVIPEWNLYSISQQEPDYLLSLLQHRATVPPEEQYWHGPDGKAGDCEFITNSMTTNGLRLRRESRNHFTTFIEGRNYGLTFEMSLELPNQELLRRAISAKYIVPQAIGELVLQRQTLLIQCLSIMIDDILDQDPAKTDPVARTRKIEIVSSSTQSEPRLLPQAKPSLQDLMLRVRDHRSYVEEVLHLLLTEPVLLTHAVNIGFFTRPELIPDERGRHLPLPSDSHMSATILVVVHSATQAAAIWRYLGRLFDLLETLVSDKTGKAIVLQELSNIYQLEYVRARTIFKQYIQIFTGSKWFHRLANRVDTNGNAMTTLKEKPEKLTRTNPQLHYMLRLCQSQTSMSQAVQWMQKLENLHEHHPAERDQLVEEELDALHDLDAIVALNQDTAKTVKLPSPSRTKGQRFLSQLRDLQNELYQLKDQIDLRDFVIPIDHLLEPNVAHTALQALDKFIIDKVGASMEFLYNDLVSNCFADIQERCQRVKDNDQLTNPIHISCLTLVVPETPEERLANRKQKFKTRPAHTLANDKTAQLPISAEPSQDLPPPSFKVSLGTATVFANLFEKSQARTAISWLDFQSAMADIGFSIVPKYGSVFTFLPPASMNAKQSLTLHRPHQSQIEGHKILVFAQRLHRLYGWDERTFEAM